jgi:PAS domain S-box-containing protein
MQHESESSPRPPRYPLHLREWVQAGILAALYLATARIGLALGAVHDVAAVVWPPTGISLAAFVVFGYRLWPGVLCGAWLANVSIGIPVWAAAGIAAGNTLEAVCATYLLQRVGFDRSLERVRDVLALVGLAALLSTPVSATLGVTSAWLAGVIPSPDWTRVWLTWWLGDATSDLVVAPALLMLSTPARLRSRPVWSAEAATLLVLLLLLSMSIFIHTHRLAGPYAVFPFLVWAALRIGQPGVVLTVFVASAVAIGGAAQGGGPFVAPNLQGRQLLLQTFMSVAAVTGLVLGAVIAERKRVEAALRSSEARFRRLADSGMLAIAIGSARMVRDANQAFLQLLGFTRADLPLDLQQLTPPEFRQVSAHATRELAMTGRCTPFEKEHFRKDGSRVPVLVGATLDRSNWEVVAVVLDLSDRKRAEEARLRLAAIVESCDDAIISKTLDGTITSWNAGAQRLYGYSAEEVIGKSISILIPPDQPDELPGIIERLKRGERIDHYETVRLRRSGERIYVSVGISPMKDVGGTIVGASAVARDMTERKRAEDALREADRRKNEFLAILSHELRNPLTPIRNAMHLLRKAPEGRIHLEWALGVMDRQVHQLTRLVDDLLQIARISAGKIELRTQPVPVATFLDSAIEAARPLIDAHHHHLISDLPAETHWIDADSARMTQVVANLLNNAAKYTPAHGRIWLTVKADGGQLLVSVRDSGIGIAADMLPRVFDPFSQADRSLARSGGGLGIGLTIVHRLVAMHGGEVRATSAGPGQGSEFVVRLPLLSRAPASSSPAEDAARAGSGAQRILVVDDNVDTADSLVLLLQLVGHDVRVAYDGPSALEAARTFQPQIVLLDIGLPGVDGYEVAQRLRAEILVDGAVIVALTGYGQAEDRERSKAAGFDHHLVKPVLPEALNQLLDSTHPSASTNKRTLH